VTVVYVVRLVFRGKKCLAALPLSSRSGSNGLPKCRFSVPMRALSRRDMVRAMPPHPAGSACAGKIRSMSRLPGRSPLPSVTLSTSPYSGLRGRVLSDPRPARSPELLDPGARDPPDLGAVSHDTSRSLRPSRKAGFPLMGLSKDRPSIVRIAESDSRARPAGRLRLTSRSLRDGKAASRPPAVLVVSHHLDGLFLLDLATLLQVAADPGVHRVSSRRETEFPAMLLPPSEAFPPPTATGLLSDSRGPASPRRPSPAGAFTANLAPSPFAPSFAPRSQFPAVFARGPGPRGLAPSSGPLHVRPFPAGRTRCSPGLG